MQKTTTMTRRRMMTMTLSRMRRMMKGLVVVAKEMQQEQHVCQGYHCHNQVLKKQHTIQSNLSFPLSVSIIKLFIKAFLLYNYRHHYHSQVPKNTDSNRSYYFHSLSFVIIISITTTVRYQKTNHQIKVYHSRLYMRLTLPVIKSSSNILSFLCDYY